MSAYEGRWKTVRVEVGEGIGWVIMNRPEKRNAMNPSMNREMRDVLEALELDDAVKVLVLTVHEDEAYFFTALQAGAAGYMLKGGPACSAVKKYASSS